MKKSVLFFIILSSVCATVAAQDSINYGYENYRRGWSLQIGAAGGYGTYRDMGTAPISFDGVLLQQNLGLRLTFPRRMEFSLVSRTALGVFEDAVKPLLNFSAFDIHNMLQFKFVKAIRRRDGNGGERRLITPYWGVAMTNFLDVTVNTNYENAAVGVSDILGPEAIGRLDFQPRWKAPVQFHGEMALMPFATVLRPGYSYIDNYSSTQPVLDALFSDFDVSVKTFAGVSTDIGIDIVTGPASRITFSYLWSYHTTGDSGHHRFDHATHLLSVDFLVKLRVKER